MEEKTCKTEKVSRLLSVLVVDDEPSVREVITEYLTSEEHTVEMAASGLEGLEKFRRGRFDLVVVDRAMPGMSGDQLVAAIKRVAPKQPVILLTGFGDIMQAIGEVPEGVDMVLGKPMTAAKLRQVVTEVTAA